MLVKTVLVRMCPCSAYDCVCLGGGGFLSEWHQQRSLVLDHVSTRVRKCPGAWVVYEHVLADQSLGVKQDKGPQGFTGVSEVSVNMYGTDSAEGDVLNRGFTGFLASMLSCLVETPL